MFVHQLLSSTTNHVWHAVFRIVNLLEHKSAIVFSNFGVQ